MANYGIITGDIVGFTKLEIAERSELIDALLAIIGRINHHKEIPDQVKFEMYRGDSFQVGIPKAEDSLRVALLIRLGLIASRTTLHSSVRRSNTWDARLSVGIGSVDYIKDSLSFSDGEAFRYSGRSFDLLKKSDRLIIRTPWTEINQELDVECFMADTIIRRLSDKQVKITYQYISENSTQKLVAEEMGITPQAVNKSLQQGGSALQEFIKRFEVLIRNAT